MDLVPSPWATPTPRRRWRGELSPLTRVLLERVVLPERRDSYSRHEDVGGPWEHEVEKAEQLGHDWAGRWFDHKEAEAWLGAHKDTISPDLAARLRDAGLSPKDAAVPLWYDTVKSDRPTLAAQVARGDMTPQEAAAAHRRAGLQD